jgi:S-adenosylmethionine:diacylglycerol 3-amino-3-carboxypropyl transferase
MPIEVATTTASGSSEVLEGGAKNVLIGVSVVADLVVVVAMDVEVALNAVALAALAKTPTTMTKMVAFLTRGGRRTWHMYSNTKSLA